jgi:hypothetical protein
MKKSNTFKKCAIATIVAGSFMAPVHAQNTISPGFDGFVSGALDLNRTKADANSFGSDQEKSSDTKGELRASVAYTSPMGVGLQLDQVYSSGKYDFDGDGATVKTTDTAAHLFYRSGNFLIGGFAQQRSYDFGYKTNDSNFYEQLDFFANALIKNRTFMGIEGQVFLGDIQIDAQLGRQNQGILGFDDSSDDLKGNFGSINANYFINDNWTVGANIGLSDWKGDISADLLSIKNRTHTYGLNTEYRFENSPISVFAKYQHTKNKLSFSDIINEIDPSISRENDFGVGIKITFGSGSLKSQATGGASLNPAKVRDNIPLGAYPYAVGELLF